MTEQTFAVDFVPLLGPCCICETTEGVCAVVMLDQRCAVPGHGWGCVLCNLPNDGAYAVLCDPCTAAWQDDSKQLRFVCRGYPADDGRMPFDELSDEPFVHDKDAHLADALANALPIGSA
jgi:hypothetical protein